jgi:hypothetical protein
MRFVNRKKIELNHCATHHDLVAARYEQFSSQFACASNRFA